MKTYKNTNDPQRSFVSAYVEQHSKKVVFFNKVKQLIDWNSIYDQLRIVYTKGLSDKGAKAYSPLLLFKMALISEWYNLSDAQTEIMVNDSLSAMRFCDLKIEDPIPGYATLHRFKRNLKAKKVYNKLLKQVNEMLHEKGLRIKKGKGIVEARLLKKRKTTRKKAKT